VTVVCERLRELDAAAPEPQPQTKRAAGATAADAPDAVLDRLGPGEPLPADVRGPMESAFEQSFGDVRLHRDAPAAALSRELSARAFAVGPHVAFGAGEFAPGTPVGDALIAHELAHVQQQRGADAAVGRKSAATAAEPALEEDADRSAVEAVVALWTRGRTAARALRANAMPRLRSGLRLNRCPGVQVQTRPTTVPGVTVPANPTGTYGAIASGAPPNWTQSVAAARSGSAADRFALVRQALPGVTILDKTADCARDPRVNHAHLVAYNSSSPTVSYDDGLNNKRDAVDNAGFTKNRDSQSFVVLGPKALGDDFYLTRFMLNHEFDHVRQHQAGSQLNDDESEVDAWTSTFCRDFHRSYIVEVLRASARINHYGTFSRLLGYYELPTVSDRVRQDARRRIREYHAQTIAPHRVHTRVFLWWIYRTIDNGANKQLARELNSELGLRVDPSVPARDMRQFPISELAGATMPAAPAVEPP
jgi:hypothetical protein